MAPRHSTNGSHKASLSVKLTSLRAAQHISSVLRHHDKVIHIEVCPNGGAAASASGAAAAGVLSDSDGVSSADPAGQSSQLYFATYVKRLRDMPIRVMVNSLTRMNPNFSCSGLRRIASKCKGELVRLFCFGVQLSEDQPIFDRRISEHMFEAIVRHTLAGRRLDNVIVDTTTVSVNWNSIGPYLLINLSSKSGLPEYMLEPGMRWTHVCFQVCHDGAPWIIETQITVTMLPI